MRWRKPKKQTCANEYCQAHGHLGPVMVEPGKLIDMYHECRMIALALRRMPQTDTPVMDAKSSLIKLTEMLVDEMVGM